MKQWLKANNLNRRKFSRITGIPYATIRTWADCKAFPNLASQRKIAKHYPECPLVSLMAALDPETKPKYAPMALERLKELEAKFECTLTEQEAIQVRYHGATVTYILSLRGENGV